MALIGKSLGDAAALFRNHLNAVLTRTITQAPLVLVAFDDRPHALLSFRRDGAPVGIGLQSGYGPLELWIGQTCGVTSDGNGSHRLYTAEYRYTITAAGRVDPLLRWEYKKVRPTRDAMWCRHHIQGQVDVIVGSTTIRLNDWHLPTGYVPLEEVIRFCICDLGVDPLSQDWDAILTESYQRFKSEFTS